MRGGDIRPLDHGRAGALDRDAADRAGLAGNPNFKCDHTRSIGLARLAPLLLAGEPAFFSPQKDLREADREILRRHPQVPLLGDALADFDDTAAIMASLTS